MNESLRPVDAVLAELDVASRKRHRRATYSLAALLACGLGLLGLISYRTQSAFAKLERLDKDVAGKTREVQDLEKKIASLNTAIRSIDPPVASAPVSTVPGVAPSPALPPAALPVRVYIHIAHESQRETAQRLTKKLFLEGYVPPGIERVARPPSRTVLKYFRLDEKDTAERILSIMRSSGLENVQLDFLPELGKRVRPNHYEIWFGSAG